jgi:hypothetical protein
MTRCSNCGKKIAADSTPCPHCLAAAARRHARFSELRAEVRRVASTLSAQMSGFVEPADAVADLWAALRSLGQASEKLGNVLKARGENDKPKA